MEVRKTMLIKETIEADGFGKPLRSDNSGRRVGRNPKSSRGGFFVEDLSSLFDIGGELGERLMGDAVKMLFWLAS